MRKIFRWFAQWYRNWYDCYNPKAFVRLGLFVPQPTNEAPLPCIIVSIRNGHSKLFFRVQNIEEYNAFWQIPPEVEEKLTQGLVEANNEADQIEEAQTLAHQRRRLPAGARLVRSDTGEVVSETRNSYSTKEDS